MTDNRSVAPPARLARRGAAVTATVAAATLVACTTSGTEPPAGLDLGPLALRGSEIAGERGCSGCHTVDGDSASGPTWKGVWLSDTTLDSGATVVADPAYLETAIVDPRSEVVDGYANIMPTYSDLDGDDVAALVAYICMLGDTPDPEECENVGG